MQKRAWRERERERSSSTQNNSEEKFCIIPARPNTWISKEAWHTGYFENIRQLPADAWKVLPFQHQNMAGRTRRKRFEGEKMVINLELRRTRQTCFQMIAQLWQKASNKLNMINLVLFMTHEVQGPGPERDPGRAPQWGLIVCVV